MGKVGKAATGRGTSGNPVTCRIRMGRILMTLVAALGGIEAAQAGGPAHRLKDINPTLSWEMGSFPRMYHSLGNLTLFLAQTHQAGEELWRSDGTEAGT